MNPVLYAIIVVACCFVGWNLGKWISLIKKKIKDKKAPKSPDPPEEGDIIE